MEPTDILLIHPEHGVKSPNCCHDCISCESGGHVYYTRGPKAYRIAQLFWLYTRMRRMLRYRGTNNYAERPMKVSIVHQYYTHLNAYIAG